MLMFRDFLGKCFIYLVIGFMVIKGDGIWLSLEGCKVRFLRKKVKSIKIF